MSRDAGLEPVARRIGLVLALGGLLVTVDMTVALVAVPAIVADLDSTLPAVQWVTTGYLLGVVAVIPAAGWAANRFGARRVYVLGLAVFTLASVLAGLAWDTTSLTAFRILQGLGGGMLNPVGQAIGLRSVSLRQRGRLMSLLGLPVLIGPVLGPPLAGWLLDEAGWRWIFLINLPVGLLAVVLCLRFLPRQDADPATPGIDWRGLAQLSTGAVLTVLGCALVGETGQAGPAVAASVTAGLMLLALFCVRALRRPDPLLDLRLLRRPPVAAGLAVLVTFSAAYFGSATILPVFIQGVRGDPAALAGAIGIPQALAVGLTMQVATRLVDRVPPRRIVLSGILLGLLGSAGLLAATATDAGYPAIVAAATVLGIGSGATILPTMTVSLRDLEGSDTARGTTVVALGMQLGAALGTAAVATTVTVSVAARVPELVRTGDGGIAGMLSLDDAARARLGADLAEAVGSAYTLPVILMALSALIAMTALGRTPRTPDERRSKRLGDVPQPPPRPTESERLMRG